MVAPVRIVRGAIADNVPHRDLLLSPDHALYLDGSLIVARQLINGGTIRQDATFRTIRYFHLELDAHAILLAEGVEAESYLDTGNRGFFVNSAAPVILHPNGDAAELRRTLSCAPFHEDEAAVAPVWRRLAMRAASLGFSDAIPAGTTDHGLRLWVGDQPVKPVLVNPGCYGFVLPAGVSEVRLRSRAAQPGDCRPWLADRRSLGVCVARIVLRGPDGVKEVPLDHPDLLEGWWTIEREGEMPRRWTDGDALLRLPRVHAPAVLEIQLAYEMIYPCQNEPAELRRGGLSRQAAGGA